MFFTFKKMNMKFLTFNTFFYLCFAKFLVNMQEFKCLSREAGGQWVVPTLSQGPLPFAAPAAWGTCQRREPS